MRVADKLLLIDKVGRELQARYRYDEIDTFLNEFGLSAEKDVSYNSKWVYAKSALKNATKEVLVQIASELDIDIPRATSGAAILPRNWKNTTDFRLFISHISRDKSKATRLKECLAPYHINGFVAHEDIHPTLEWQKEIERALYAMDAFLSIHTVGFGKSVWTQQEVGFAVCRGVKIISLKMGEDPVGFISQHQALARRGRTAEQIAKEIRDILDRDSLTATRFKEVRKASGPASPSWDGEIPF